MLNGLMSMFRNTSSIFVREGNEDIISKNTTEWSTYVERLGPLSLFGSDNSQSNSIGQYLLDSALQTPFPHLRYKAATTLLRFSLAVGSYRFLLGSVLLALENPSELGTELIKAMSSLDFYSFACKSYLLLGSSFFGKYSNVFPAAIRSPLLQPITSIRTSELLFSSITCDTAGHLFIFDENTQCSPLRACYLSRCSSSRRF